MAIIISKDGKNAKKVDKIPIAKEDYLQKYIYDNPDAIPLYDYKEDIRVLILCREFSTKTGPIDAIGIDKDGEIYLIETKLYKNSDKRQVIAQVLDYGASLWSTYKDPLAFFNSLEESVAEEFGAGLQQKAKEFFELDEDEWTILFENLKENVHEGRFRFVVLMDKLHSQLKDLILFINSNSNFDVFAVEVEYYKHEDLEIIIPKLFGEEAKGPSNASRDRWTKGKFLEEASKKMNEKAFSMLKSLLEFTEQYASRLDWGTGKESGSFTFKMNCPESESGRISLFTIWTKGKIRFRFRNILNHAGIRFTESYFQKLSSFPFARNWNKTEVVEQSPGSDIEEAFPDEKTFEKFKLTIREFVNECATKMK